MLILGIDTSGQQGSVALLQAEDGQLRTLDLAQVAGRHYSELLVPTIANLLERHQSKISSVGLITVASGPGSFTGLRVAIATVKGLAEAFSIPVVAISVLEAVAQASDSHTKIVTALDAQRSQVFYAEYDLSSVEPALLGHESIATLSEFADAVRANAQIPAITPDATLATKLQPEGVNLQIVTRPAADTFAQIGYRKFLAGEQADTSTLDANYVRRSDAELFSAPKLGIVP